jgi:hypothetical protein
MLGGAIQQAWRIHLCWTEPVCGTGASLQGEVRGALVRGKCAGLGMERVSCGGSEPEALALHPFWVASRGRKRLFLGFF